MMYRNIIELPNIKNYLKRKTIDCISEKPSKLLHFELKKNNFDTITPSKVNSKK